MALFPLPRLSSQVLRIPVIVGLARVACTPGRLLIVGLLLLVLPQTQRSILPEVPGPEEPVGRTRNRVSDFRERWAIHALEADGSHQIIA